MKLLTPILLSSLFVGCSDRPPARMSYLEVTKPPLKVVYIDKQGSITPEMISSAIRDGQMFPYKEYKFNDGTIISGTTSFIQSDTEVDSDSESITIQRTPNGV